MGVTHELTPVDSIPPKGVFGGGGGRNDNKVYRDLLEKVMAQPGQIFKIAEWASPTGATSKRRKLVETAKEALAAADGDAEKGDANSPIPLGKDFDIEARKVGEGSALFARYNAGEDEAGNDVEVGDDEDAE